MFNIVEANDVARKLLIVLGLEIEKNTSILVDQETKNQLSFEGKFIKINIDSTRSLFLSEHDVQLDFFNPECTRIVERLFGRYLDIESSEEIQNLPEVLSYYFDRMCDPNTDEDKCRLTIKFGDGNKWEGNWFRNKIICFDEALLRLDEVFKDINLYPYDIDWTIENDCT